MACPEAYPAARLPRGDANRPLLPRGRRLRPPHPPPPDATRPSRRSWPRPAFCWRPSGPSGGPLGPPARDGGLLRDAQGRVQRGRDAGEDPSGTGDEDAVKITACTYGLYVNRLLGRPQGRIKELWA